MKYRQRGYRDDDRDEDRQRRPAPRAPRDKTGRPGGRGLGQPTATVFRCAVCGHQHSSLIELDSVCAKCGKDLHTCTHCAFFDTSAPNECTKSLVRPPSGEPRVEYVSSKAKRNRCELFEPKAAQEFAREPASGQSGRAAFDALFKT